MWLSCVYLIYNYILLEISGSHSNIISDSYGFHYGNELVSRTGNKEIRHFVTTNYDQKYPLQTSPVYQCQILATKIFCPVPAAFSVLTRLVGHSGRASDWWDYHIYIKSDQVSVRNVCSSVTLGMANSVAWWEWHHNSWRLATCGHGLQRSSIV